MMPSAQRRFSNDISAATEITPGRRGIPFDYAFRYELQGKPGNVINSLVTISIEATFTAVSIGYGVVPDVQPIIFGPPPPVGGDDATLGFITLDEIIKALDAHLKEPSSTRTRDAGPEAVFKNGIKLNPAVAELALQNRGGQTLSDDVLARLFQVVASPPELIQFKYAIFDEGSGREFQSEPILNIAGLGSASGERPFRYFAQPVTFRPRSTIRMEVTEVSDFKGQLHVSLHGYKVLGGSDSPTATAQRSTTRRR
ncbi:MAG TPA: hypothetical protein VGN86_12945 [Pyrinomonadaceae bacterium]|jgi:hypothetical protein|nr:hypothetical protein [Pyrinomonadaceae bacterium]